MECDDEKTIPRKIDPLLPALIVPYSILETNWSDIWQRLRAGPWQDCVKRNIFIKCVEFSHERRAELSLNWCKYPEKTWTWTCQERSFKQAKMTYCCIEPNRPESCSSNIILLHGFTSSKYSWRFLAPHLAEVLNFRVWVIDLLGHGHSDAPAGGYEPTLFVDQITAFMDSQRINDAHFCGHSLGGGLSMIVALRYPERVKSIILLGALLYPIAIGQFWEWIHLLGKVLPYCGDCTLRGMIKHCMGNYDNQDGASIWTTMDLDHYVEPVLKQGRWAAILSMLKNFDNAKLERLAKEYHRIKQPLLAVYGNCDTTTPCSAAFQLLGACPQTQVHILDKTGHLLTEELPLSIQRLVERFLNR